MQRRPLGRSGLSIAPLVFGGNVFGWIEQAVDDSLRRLQTDVIDLYQSHWPDETPEEETLGAYEKLLKAGKVRAIGASNLDATQLNRALDVAATRNLPRYETLQPEYNLYDRAKFDGPLRDLVIRESIGVITYFSLASGFLSGKYRSKADLDKSKRGGGVAKYLDERGLRILATLDDVSAQVGAKPAEVALAWVMARAGVTAPIASATSRAQLASLVRSAELDLPPEALRLLDEASG